MNNVAHHTKHTAYYQVRSDKTKATRVDIADGTELAHAGKTPDDVLVLLKEINKRDTTYLGAHLTIQVCGKASSSGSFSAQHAISPSFGSFVTVGVVKLRNHSLLSDFTYADIFMDKPYTADGSPDNQVLCSIESNGHFFEANRGLISRSGAFQFFDSDIVTLIATYSGYDLFFSFAKNGDIIPALWKFHLLSQNGEGPATPFFFVQLNNISLKVIGDITATQSYLPNPQMTYSLLLYKLQRDFISALVSHHMPAPVSKPETVGDEPPGLCVDKSKVVIESSPTQPTMVFSAMPRQQQSVTPQLSNNTISDGTVETIFNKPDSSKVSTTISKEKHEHSAKSSSSSSSSLVELSNICGLGKQMGRHTIYADNSTMYAEIDLGQIKAIPAQNLTKIYSFSAEAVKLDTPQFSLGVFSIIKSLTPSASVSFVINRHEEDFIKPNIRLLCVHKDILAVLPPCVLFPLLLSSNSIEPNIPSFNVSGLYDFLVREDGIEVQCLGIGSIKIDRFTTKNIDVLSHLFEKDIYDKIASLEDKLINGVTDSNLTIGSYTICISVNTAYVSVLQQNDIYLETIRTSKDLQIKSSYTLTQLSTKVAWEQVAEKVCKQLNSNGPCSNDFRFLRNTLGFMGFVDISYRIATADTEGVVVTTPIPLIDHEVTEHKDNKQRDKQINKHSDPISICGVSIPKGCRLQLVSYDISNDRKLEGRTNIAQDYFLNLSGKSEFLDSSMFSRSVYQSKSIETYEFLYETIFSKRTGSNKANTRDKKENSMEKALLSALKQVLPSSDRDTLLAAALEHLRQPNYLYDVFISRELDRVQSPVRSSVVRHTCAFHADIDKIRTGADASSKGFIETWNRLKSTVEAGIPFWIFFNDIINIVKKQSEQGSDFIVTSNTPYFNGRDFLIVAHRVGARVLYVLYADGKPVQTVLTTKPINIMMMFDSPWAMISKHNLCKSPTYVPNYLRLISWTECFQKSIPFTPYLPSYLEMIPLTSSLNLEMDSSTMSSNNANSLALYNNTANKMSHWESLSFVGSNSLVVPQTTNIYISIYSPYNQGDEDLSILCRSLFRQYGSKSPRGSYEEGNYVSLVASQYRQHVSSHVGIHKFNNKNTYRLDINNTITNIGKNILNAPPSDHVLDNVSMYRFTKDAKANFLTENTNNYYGNSYNFNGTENLLLKDKSIKALKEKIANVDSYKFGWHDLEVALGDMYYEPILLFLCMGHCIDYTHMFNTEELFYKKNDIDTIILNLLLLVFGGGNISKPYTHITNLLIDSINEKARCLNDSRGNNSLLNGNIGPIERSRNPRTLLDISFPPNILRDEYRSFYNYDKLCYVYANNAFETYHFGENSKNTNSGQRETKITGAVSLAPTCNPPASVYVRFEYIYVPKSQEGAIDNVLRSEDERINKVIDDLDKVGGRQAISDDPSFPQLELVGASPSQQLYAFPQKTSPIRSPGQSIVNEKDCVTLFNSSQSAFSNVAVSNKEGHNKTSGYIVSNCGYAVDAINLHVCVLLSEMLPNRPLYSHCLKVVVRFQGEYGRFMIDRYSSTFSCARFVGDDRGKKKYIELRGDMRVTVILDYKQMFIFMFAQDLTSNNQTNAQRVPWKINWPVRFMVLLSHAFAEITTLEN